MGGIAGSPAAAAACEYAMDGTATTIQAIRTGLTISME
jgi:hypothetical protein